MVVDKLLTPFLRLPHFKGKTRLEELLRRLVWAPNRTRVFDGLKMELDPAEWTQMQLLKGNWLEPRTLELYASAVAARGCLCRCWRPCWIPLARGQAAGRPVRLGHCHRATAIQRPKNPGELARESFHTLKIGSHCRLRSGRLGGIVRSIDD